MGSGERGLKRLIVTGDDFGASLPVNEAIETAHARGILTATCLMVGGPQAADAVARARRLPTLAVGLHVVVSRGRPVLPRAAIPDLVDADGRFETSLVRAGLRYFFRPRARRQLAAEIEAQFKAFRETGLALDHVNAHNHMHLHPSVLGLILTIGRRYGLAAVRVPSEPPPPKARFVSRLRERLLLGPWIALMKWRLRRAGIRHNDHLFGLRDSGHMDRERLISVLERLPEGVTEIHCHPAAERPTEAEAQAAGYRFEAELEALIDPAVAAAAARSGARLIAFREL